MCTLCSLLGNLGFVFFFFNLKLILNIKYLENIVITLINISMATRNPKNISKKQNQFEAKMILAVRFTSSGKEKEKKHIGQTTLMKWNLLKPK